MPLPFAFIAYLHFALLLAVAVRLCCPLDVAVGGGRQAWQTYCEGVERERGRVGYLHFAAN